MRHSVAMNLDVLRSNSLNISNRRPFINSYGIDCMLHKHVLVFHGEGFQFLPNFIVENWEKILIFSMRHQNISPRKGLTIYVSEYVSNGCV